MGETPDLLTVEEAARVLRIGRTTAYKEVRRYLETGGREGIPVIAVGALQVAQKTRPPTTTSSRNRERNEPTPGRGTTTPSQKSDQTADSDGQVPRRRRGQT